MHSPIIHVIVADCDICRVEFPSSKPNPAAWDGPPAYGGPWMYACVAHGSNLNRKLRRRIDGKGKGKGKAK
jgi:hypothetical protein